MLPSMALILLSMPRILLVIARVLLCIERRRGRRHCPGSVFIAGTGQAYQIAG
jgi:hypothetical protein